MVPSGIATDEALTAIVWAALTVGAIRAALRAPRGQRHTWVVVAASCGIFVADKLLDIQTAFFSVVRWLMHAVVSQQTREEAGDALRYILLLPLTALAMAAVVWFVRRDRHIDRPRRLALAGVCGIVGYVGLRLLPPVSGAFEGFTGWLVEGPCAGLVFVGIRSGLRGRDLGRRGRSRRRSMSSR